MKLELSLMKELLGMSVAASEKLARTLEISFTTRIKPYFTECFLIFPNFS